MSGIVAAGKLLDTLSTVACSSTTALQREGLIERSEGVPGYTLRFAAYCEGKYPGVHPRLVHERPIAHLNTK